MNGLAPHTGKLIDALSRLECIKPYTLVGGTALSIQLGTRQSEDLDFQSWRVTRSDKREVDWFEIEKQLSSIGELQNRDILDIDHVEFVVSDVKVSFYACDKFSPIEKPVPFLHNIKLADVIALGAMKMEVMLRRNNFRDYYDIYSILKSGVNIHTLIDKALEYSRHRLKTKNLLSMLTRGELFTADANFKQLQPIYDVSADEIESYIRGLLTQST